MINLERFVLVLEINIMLFDLFYPGYVEGDVFVVLEIGGCLKKLCISLGYNLLDLLCLLGFFMNNVVNIESGERILWFLILFELLDLFGINLGDFLKGGR